MLETAVATWFVTVAVAAPPHAAIQQGDAAGPVTLPRRPTPVQTVLIETRLDGSLAPLAHAEAWLIAKKDKPGAHGASTETAKRWRSMSTGSGGLSFSEVEMVPGARFEIAVPHQGVLYRSTEFGLMDPAPPEVRVHGVVPAPSGELAPPLPGRLTLQVALRIDLLETELRFTETVRVLNEGHVTIDYTHAPRGLHVPILAVPLGRALEGRIPVSGIVPKGRLHGVKPPSLGQGTLVSEAGGVAYRGPVPPGGGLYFELSETVPFSTEALRLGFVSDLDLTLFAVTFASPDRAAPDLRLEVPSRSGHDVRQGFNVTEIVATATLPAGTPVVLSFDRLPIQSSIPRTLAIGGGSVLALVFGVLFFSVWLRRASA